MNILKLILILVIILLITGCVETTPTTSEGSKTIQYITPTPTLPPVENVIPSYKISWTTGIGWNYITPINEDTTNIKMIFTYYGMETNYNHFNTSYKPNINVITTFYKVDGSVYLTKITNFDDITIGKECYKLIKVPFPQTYKEERYTKMEVKLVIDDKTVLSQSRNKYADKDIWVNNL